jgi:hypothetical protein
MQHISNSGKPVWYLHGPSEAQAVETQRLPGALAHSEPEASSRWRHLQAILQR